MLQSLLEAAAGFLSSLCTLKECAVVQLLARSGPWHAVMGPATLPSERPAERARARSLCCRVDITQGAAKAPKLDHCELIAHDNCVGDLSVLGLVLGRNLFMSVAADQLNIFMTANFVSWIQTVCPAVTVLFPRNVSAPFEYSFNVG